MRKRGQITIFLIIGILIFLGMFVFFLIRDIRLKGAIEPEIYEGISLPEQLESVNSYVGFCIEQESVPSIERIALFGGTFETDNRLEYDAENVNVLCKKERGKGCVQNVLLREKMGEELAALIQQRLLLCLDLSKFEEKGYTLTYDPQNLHVDARIGVEDVSVSVDFPITLERGTSVLKTEQYNERITVPLGRMFELAIDIVNKEIENGFFNKDEWMAADSTIIIEKHKPYPNTVYLLKKGSLVFKFAIEGIDAVGSYPEDVEQEYGCCVVDEMCYQNIAGGVCKGEYEQSCSCKTRSVKTGLAVYSDCDDRKHGESWCEYAGGVDTVGSRHYLHSCVNGEELVEECRDYREEICAEKDNKAVCRVNRWKDCHKCETKECCEDTSLRDCGWENLQTAKQCVPAVAPGLKFWKSSQVCAAGNEKKEYRGSVNRWIDSTAVLCYSLGDCGNYYNIAGRLTKNGFVNTAGRESEDVYDIKKTVDVPLDTRKQVAVAAGQYGDISVGSQHLSNFLNFISSADAGKSSFSKCNLWTAPTRTNDCKLCEDEGVCSEYKCKSLDENCIYTESLGIPTCETPRTIDRVAPRIFIDEDALTEGYAASNANINNWYDGYEVVPAIKPHTPITVAIKTSEDTRCKITYLPENDFRILPPYWFGDSSYKTHHNITIRLPSLGDVDSKLTAALNLTSLEKILDVPGFLVQPIARLAAIKLLDEFKLGKYYVFVKCNDKSGNVNEDEFFIKFRINQTDAAELELVSTKPENGDAVAFTTENVSINLYLNKLSECRASAEDEEFRYMELGFKCAGSEFEVSPDGTYLCQAEIPFEEIYYVSCSDNATKLDFGYYLTRANELEIIRTEPGAEVSTTSVELIVETSESEEVGCRYSSGREYFAMDKVNFTFTAQVEDLEENTEYSYNVVCEDKYGNEAGSEIGFTVLE